MEFTVNIEDNNYPYFLTEDYSDVRSKLNCFEYDKLFFIYDSNISSEEIGHLRKQFESTISYFTELDVLEEMKRLSYVESLVDTLMELGISRQSIIIPVGGGVLGNIVGLASSILFRGIRFVHIPTTVMAAADSVLSLKQAVNTSYSKNLLGSYHCPECVIVNYRLFKSLPDRDYKSGLAETVKNILAISPSSFEKFSEFFCTGIRRTRDELYFVIKQSIEVKNSVLKNDKFERKEGLILEYGHTIGHAYEILNNGKLRHGEAVAFGLLVACEISYSLGFLSDESVSKHYEMVEMIDVLSEIDINDFDKTDEIWEQILLDNKRGYRPLRADEAGVILLSALGDPHIDSSNIVSPITQVTLLDAIDKTLKKIH